MLWTHSLANVTTEEIRVLQLKVARIRITGLCPIVCHRDRIQIRKGVTDTFELVQLESNLVNVIRADSAISL
jgi:hypothetical protein